MKINLLLIPLILLYHNSGPEFNASTTVEGIFKQCLRKVLNNQLPLILSVTYFFIDRIAESVSPPNLIHLALAASRTALAASRTALTASRTALTASRTALTASRTALAASRTALAASRTALAASRTALTASRTAANDCICSTQRSYSGLGLTRRREGQQNPALNIVRDFVAPHDIFCPAGFCCPAV